jgi:hypothetical protein
MQIKIDIKSLIVGLIIGAVVFLAMGQVYSGAGEADFGFTVDRTGFAIVRDKAGIAYVIDPQRERAKIIFHGDGPYKGRPFNLDRTATAEETK